MAPMNSIYARWMPQLPISEGDKPSDLWVNAAILTFTLAACITAFISLVLLSFYLHNSRRFRKTVRETFRPLRAVACCFPCCRTQPEEEEEPDHELMDLPMPDEMPALLTLPPPAYFATPSPPSYDTLDNTDADADTQLDHESSSSGSIVSESMFVLHNGPRYDQVGRLTRRVSELEAYNVSANGVRRCGVPSTVRGLDSSVIGFEAAGCSHRYPPASVPRSHRSDIDRMRRLLMEQREYTQ